MARRSNECTVYNADEKNFVIYAGHFVGDITIAWRVKTVCVNKSDGEIRNAYRILVDDLFSFRSMGLKADKNLGGKWYYDGFNYGRQMKLPNVFAVSGFEL